MFHRLNDKGDNSLTEIPGYPGKRILATLLITVPSTYNRLHKLAIVGSRNITTGVIRVMIIAIRLRSQVIMSMM
jgi:hypothetical protein